MKGQMMIITSVIVSTMMLSLSASVSNLDDKNHQIRDEAYIANMLKDEAEKVDTRINRDRQNFEEMVRSVEGYTASVDYWYTQDCFNVTLTSRRSDINLRCIG